MLHVFLYPLQRLYWPEVCNAPCDPMKYIQYILNQDQQGRQAEGSGAKLKTIYVYL